MPVDEVERTAIIHICAVVAGIVGTAAVLYASPLYDRTPYHTSALTGEDWVLELLHGHPERIRCELGIRKHVFHLLIDTLKGMGVKRSRDVSLEEQLSIFLYMCITGLSVRHVGERFQRANETISV